MAFESALARKTGKANFSFELITFFVKLTVSRPHLGRHVCSTVQRQRANTPVVHVVSRSGSGLQWGVYGSGADCVYSDVLWGELHSQRSGEGNDGSLGGGVVHHACRSLEGGDGGGVDYRGSGLEVWNGISETRISRRAPGGSALGDLLGQGDHGNDVRLEGALDVAELRAESDDGLYAVHITLTSMSWMASHMICLEALLTRISSLPWSSRCLSMMVLQLSSFIRSKASVRHLRPSFSIAFLTF